jgi:hypothetical protein
VRLLSSDNVLIAFNLIARDKQGPIFVSADSTGAERFGNWYGIGGDSDDRGGPFATLNRFYGDQLKGCFGSSVDGE